jgi:tetratricopeptide (TPR) repeat protein
MVVNDPALVRVMPALTNLRRGMAEIEVDVLYSDWLSVAQAIEEANGALRFRLKDELINRCRTAAAQSVSVCIARERQEKEALGCWLVAMVNTASHDVSSIAAGCEAALKEVGTGLTDLAVHRWLRQCADEEKAESALQAADQTLEELWRAGERMPEQRAEELCRRELFHQDALTRMTGKNKKYRPATPIFLLHSTLRALVRTTLQKDRDVAAVLRNDPVGALRRKHKLGPVNASALSKEWSMCGDLAEKCNRRFRVKTPYVFACRCQELARELDADNLAAWFHLGWQQLYMGRYDDAAKSFREIDDRRGYEAYPTALAGLAKVYENRREFEAAAEYYTRCSRLQLSNWEGLIETISQVLDQLADPAVCLAVILNTLGTAALSASEDIGGKRDRGLEWLRQLEQGESAPEETGAQSGAASGEVGAVLIVYRPAVIDKFRQQLDICRRKLAENLPKGARNLWNLAITMDSDAVSTKVLCVQRALELYQRYCMYVRDSDESVAARERVALLTKQLRRLRPPS